RPEIRQHEAVWKNALILPESGQYTEFPIYPLCNCML
ncbi:MAG: hypothetical protein ACI9BH_000706, partial [Paracoccaceae bacterium]